MYENMDELKPKIITLRITKDQLERLQKGSCIIKHDINRSWIKASYQVPTGLVLIRLAHIQTGEYFLVEPEHMTRLFKKVGFREMYSVKLVISKIIDHWKSSYEKHSAEARPVVYDPSTGLPCT